MAIWQDSPEANRVLSWMKRPLWHWPPEALEGKWTAKTDIWGWAVSTFYLATNECPFGSTDPDYEIPKSLVKLLPEGLKDLLMSVFLVSLEKRPSAKLLKRHPYFKGIDWKTIATTPPPTNLGETGWKLVDPDQLKEWRAFIERARRG
jgi:serine/threonine protein kinase